MRLCVAYSWSLFPLLLRALVSKTAQNRWISHRVYKCVGISIALGITFSELAFATPQPTPLKDSNASPEAASPNEFIRASISCPSTITDLVPFILRDIPSYANRVSTRAQVWDRSFNPRGVVIAAAQASEDEQIGRDLPNWLGDLQLTEDAIATHQLIPLFFTTLERQYVNDRAVRIQHYHWAFLSHTPHEGRPNQWHLALLFSRIGDYPADQPVSPPRESSQGSIGRALHLWLRDCNAGSVGVLHRPTTTTLEGNSR